MNHLCWEPGSFLRRETVLHGGFHREHRLRRSQAEPESCHLRVLQGDQTQTDTSPEKTSRWPRGTQRDSTSLITREMRTKTTRSYHLTPARTSSSQSLETTDGGEGVEKREPSHPAGGEVNWRRHYREQYGGSSKMKHKVSASGQTNAQIKF